MGYGPDAENTPPLQAKDFSILRTDNLSLGIITSSNLTRKMMPEPVKIFQRRLLVLSQRVLEDTERRWSVWSGLRTWPVQLNTNKDLIQLQVH